MLETLAGRLKWKRIADGIRVEIPERAGWYFYLSAIYPFLVAHFTAELYWKLGAQMPSGFARFIPDLIGLLLGVAWLLIYLSFTNRLTLTAEKMTIERRIFGGFPKVRAVQTASLSNLHFQAVDYPLTTDGLGEVQVDDGGKTRRFASRIKDAEAQALIARMMEVYKFPRTL
jgi:hypothetical protein